MPPVTLLPTYTSAEYVPGARPFFITESVSVAGLSVSTTVRSSVADSQGVTSCPYEVAVEMPTLRSPMFDTVIAREDGMGAPPSAIEKPAVSGSIETMPGAENHAVTVRS